MKSNNHEIDRPAIFIHKGNQYYLKYTVGLAERYCSKVVLIGDATNRNIAVNHYDIEECIDDQFREFKDLYQHMSTNPYDYELFCFERYFLMYGYMEKHDIDEAVMFDSDELIYINISKFNYGNCDAVVGYNNCQASPNLFYVKRVVLKEVLDFFIEIYRNNIELLKGIWQENVDTGKAGGISDMVLLYMWIEHTSYKVYNYNSDYYAGWFDQNINLPDEPVKFKMRSLKSGQIKSMIKVKCKGEYSIRVITEDDNERELYAIQAQGSAKAYIPCFAKGIFDDPWLSIVRRYIEKKEYTKITVTKIMDIFRASYKNPFS